MAKQRSHQLNAPNRAPSRTRHRPLHRALRGVANLLGSGAFVLLGLSVLGLVAAITLASTHTPAAQPARALQPGIDVPNSTAGDGSWIPIRSTSPGDIIAAARRSELFNERGSVGGDHVTNISRLGAPVLVHALQPPGAAASTYPDFYVLPILDNKGTTTDAAELQLNANHTAIQVIAIVTYSEPRTRGSIPRMDAAKARGALNAQHHTSLRQGTAAELVYFPGDAAAQQTGQITWAGGGEFPADPIWLMSGADRREYVVGTDGHVYDLSQLPIVPAGQ
ncbi:MAG TPA: hypothetical protein VFU63_09180 [Ktedonobacterales bacterium]|nr:hypothetical protein [Ktedonobacterales bacterium]